MEPRINIASFPTPNPDTYYFWLYYQHLEEYGYRLIDTRGQSFDCEWVQENRDRVQILHFHWPAYIYSDSSVAAFIQKLLSFYQAIREAKRSGYKILWTVHNLFPHERNNIILEYIGRVILASLADVVFVHFAQAKKKVSLLFGRTKNVEIIPHGTFSSIFKNNCSKAEARTALGLAPQSFVYLLFGPVRPYKGIEKAIEAFKLLDISDSVLVIAGRPSDKGLSETVIAEAQNDDRIKPFLKFIEEDEVQFFFNAADVVLLPYNNVFTSGNLFLALTFDKPVIAPATGIITEVVDSSFGIIYDPADKGALLAAIKTVMQMDLVTAATASAARARLFSWQSSAEISHQAITRIL
ncbi:glycosyltransferase [Geomonas terrae]|uniref:Glycosyltransferase n=1 Tax=Geomonas terrae TaxID=2562681 RepID=A0A4S1CAQ5_9BACT|nr:glycosyltransferase [Geomonas terrae]TGU70213.1 glycosyltransferase [Geomonas terrae]